MTIDTTEAKQPKLFIAPEWDFDDKGPILYAAVAYEDPFKVKQVPLGPAEVRELYEYLGLKLRELGRPVEAKQLALDIPVSRR